MRIQCLVTKESSVRKPHKSTRAQEDGACTKQLAKNIYLCNIGWVEDFAVRVYSVAKTGYVASLRVGITLTI